ncbi:MAG: bifunctional diaminohydroxyphosphoribosylaminopyrimidine deaminase/5-amino-6-(5-phosphoribosylamino)uracil reductase RibD [Aquificaceae bacterium]
MEDTFFMQRALELAKKRKGLTNPNPTVGCLIVKDGKIIAEGYHEKAGMPHAEVVALERAKEVAKGSTVYVTLEPCTHYGRTPPCTDALIRAKVKRVVIAALDPNPLVHGMGVKKLRDAGVEVKVGVLEDEAKELNEDFFTYITQKRPYITLKLAQSIDGRIATKVGDSKWITNEESRAFAHKLRSETNAVLVGINTVLRDNPLLTVRAFPWERQPIRVVLDPSLKIPLDCNLVKDRSARTLVVTAKYERDKVKNLENEGVEVLLLKPEDGSLKISEVLKELYIREVMHVLVEGGGQTVTSFIREGIYERLFVFVAPIILGDGIGIGALGIERVSQANKLTLRKVLRFGNDLGLEYVRG